MKVTSLSRDDGPGARHSPDVWTDVSIWFALTMFGAAMDELAESTRAPAVVERSLPSLCRLRVAASRYDTYSDGRPVVSVVTVGGADEGGVFAHVWPPRPRPGERAVHRGMLIGGEPFTVLANEANTSIRVVNDHEGGAC